MNDNWTPAAPPSGVQGAGSAKQYVGIEATNGPAINSYVPNGVPVTPQKKRLSFRAIFWIVVLAGGLLLAVGSAISMGMFRAKWNGFDPYGTNPDGGSQVIAYDETYGEFSKSFIPASDLAGSQEDVGYVLLFKKREESAGAFYGPGMKYVSGEVETVHVTLRDYRTGETVAEKTFESSAPRTVSSNQSSFHTSVSSSDVEYWVAQELKTARAGTA